MVSPSLIVILIVAAFPIAYAIWLSLHQYSVIHPGLSRWVGLDNYGDALKSSEFWSAVKVTFIFSVISVSLELVLGMGMALLMHAAFRGRSVLRAVVLVPWAILTVGTALTWRLQATGTAITAAHLHVAPKGVNGPVVVGFFNNTAGVMAYGVS